MTKWRRGNERTHYSPPEWRFSCAVFWAGWRSGWGWPRSRSLPGTHCRYLEAVSRSFVPGGEDAMPHSLPIGHILERPSQERSWHEKDRNGDEGHPANMARKVPRAAHNECYGLSSCISEWTGVYGRCERVEWVADERSEWMERRSREGKEELQESK